MDNRVIRNYILLITTERLEIFCKPKENLYLLVTILGDLIFYKNGVIRIKIELVELRIKEWKIVINFNILLLGNNKAVLKMLKL